MLFVSLVNSVLCEISMYFEWADARAAYAACLRAAEGTAEDRECYFQLLNDVGEVALEYVSCLF